MKERKRRRLKKFKFHPVTSLILLLFFVVILSGVLSLFNLQASYRVVDPTNQEIRTVAVEIVSLLNYDGFKYLISSASSNFASFSGLTTLLIGLIGLSIAHASGLIDAFIQRITLNVSNKVITFFLILIAVASNLVNDIGYGVLIPFGALIFLANKRSPLLGITAAFSGVAFGYGANFFVGATEISLIPFTSASAKLIETEMHIALMSNIFIMIASTIIIAIVGTIVTESIIIKRIGRYRVDDDISSDTREEKILSDLDDSLRIERKLAEKRGLRYAAITGILIVLSFIYMIIPNLPLSGILLDMNQKAYIHQLFGSHSYFHDGFTYMVSLLFVFSGVAYAIGAKTVKNDKELLEKAAQYLRNVGYVVLIVFFFVQVIAAFRASNIGLLISCYGAELIQTLGFKSVPLIILTMVTIGISGLFYPSMVNKWTIFSPVVIPLMMQSNISPQFAQFIFRAADSMSKGITPLMGYFVIYLAYLNIYNTNKEPITIKKALHFIYPYALIIALTWIFIILGWYLVGLPIGPNVYPTM